MQKIELNSRRGFTLLEVLIAAALLSIISLGLLTALGGASKVLLRADTRETARDLAQAQMEDVQNQEYNPSDPSGVLVFYPKLTNLSTDYPDYDVEVLAVRIDKSSGIINDTGLQEITVVVKHTNEIIFTLTGMKVFRE